MIIENIIVASVFIFLAFIATIIPLIYGAIKKLRVMKPVEYLPPQGASPIDFLIEYYGASANPRELFNPLMLYWADCGFITIEEDCKRGLKLTKLKDLQSPESGDGFNPDTFELEQELFNYIFSGKNKTFYTLTAFHTFKDKFERITNSCKKQAKKITAVKSKKFTIFGLVSSLVMLLAVTLIVGISLGDNMAIMMAFPLAAILMSKLILSLPGEGDGLPKGSAIRLFLFPFFMMAGGVPYIVMLANIPLNAAVIFIIAMAVCLLNVYFLSEKIDVRTDEQLKTYARICGFKKFLLRAEIRQLEMLVEEDPKYYYNILPYCYVLKITKKLKPKFDRIALDGPAWYLGELRDILMF